MASEGREDGKLPPLPTLPAITKPHSSSRAAQLQRELGLGPGLSPLSAAPPYSSSLAVSIPVFGPDPAVEFDLTEKIGEGSFGCVWRALHKQSGQTFAVKILVIDENIDELNREVTTMAQLHHKNIVQFFTSYRLANELWLVMEFCAGRSLRNIMKSTKRPLHEDQIACAMAQILRALEYLHDLAKIHRDIKSGNILLQMDGQAKLGDFGVAGQITETQKRRHTMIGSPYWMAPEVIEDLGHDQKADIWSLGITAIELAQMDPPSFDQNPMRVIFSIPHSPPPTLSDPSRWSPSFSEFLSNCLVKDPEKRWSAKELQRLPFITTAKSEECLEALAKEHDAFLKTTATGLTSPKMMSLDGSISRSMSLSPDVDKREISTSFGAAGSTVLRALNDLQSAGCTSCSRLKSRVEALEKKVEELNTQLMAATAEANMFKGQVQVYERVFSGGSFAAALSTKMQTKPT